MSEIGTTEILDKLSKIDNAYGGRALFVDTSMIAFRRVFRYNVNQVDTVVLVPPEGFKLCIRNISSSSSANTGIIKMDFVTSNKAVYDHFVSVNSKSESVGGHVVGALGEGLTINTTTGANDISISIVYTYHK